MCHMFVDSTACFMFFCVVIQGLFDFIVQWQWNDDKNMFALLATNWGSQKQKFRNELLGMQSLV